MHFGPHLALDLNDCNTEKLADLQLIFDLLNELPVAIGMTKITQPYVFPYSGLRPEDRGVTGFVVIAESHISIHTFQEKNYAFFDVFSCKDFDWGEAERIIVDKLECRSSKRHLAFRGSDFPR